MFTGKLTSDRMNEILKDWPENPREVAQKITKMYGPPDEATDSLLIWYENGPWKSRSFIVMRFRMISRSLTPIYSSKLLTIRFPQKNLMIWLGSMEA
jgi:hypothetical protein